MYNRSNPLLRVGLRAASEHASVVQRRDKASKRTAGVCQVEIKDQAPILKGFAARASLADYILGRYHGDHGAVGPDSPVELSHGVHTLILVLHIGTCVGDAVGERPGIVRPSQARRGRWSCGKGLADEDEVPLGA